MSGKGQGVTVKFTQLENKSGNGRMAAQGFGKVTARQPRKFDPVHELAAACAFFEENGFAVLSNCLSAIEIAHLNEFCERTQLERPDAWGLGNKRKGHHRNQGLIFSQPLLDYPELDPYTQHPMSFPVVARLLGGVEHVRFAEFNFRETPENAGIRAMNFHHDAVVADRLLRKPYMPCDYLCAIHYLTDVGPGTPSFCVVPKSNRFEELKDAYAALGNEYEEVPLHGAAGTCILYDSALFHTRLDGDGRQPRRTWHQYYARGGWLRSWLPTSDRYVRAPSPVLTDWNLFPERLAMHPDPKKRLFFCHWNTAMAEWVASGFDDAVRRAMPRGEQ